MNSPSSSSPDGELSQQYMIDWILDPIGPMMAQGVTANLPTMKDVDKDKVRRGRSDDDSFFECSTRTYDIVFEIVGAMGLSSLLDQQQRRTKKNTLLNLIPTDLSSMKDTLQNITQKFSSSTKTTTTSSASSSSSLDPYCIVRSSWNGGCEIHRTSVIYNDDNPIWTCRSKSICLIRIPESCLHPTDIASSETNSCEDVGSVKQNANGTAARNDSSSNSSVCNYQSVGSEHDSSAVASSTSHDDSCVTIEIYHESNCLGKVNVSTQQLLNGTGQRVEFEVQNRNISPVAKQRKTPTLAIDSPNYVPISTKSPAATAGNNAKNNDNSKNLSITPFPTSIPSLSNNLLKASCVLALRYRPATVDDVLFIQELQTNTVQVLSENIAADINLDKVQHQSIFLQKQRKTVNKNDTTDTNSSSESNELCRVKPHPDPSKMIEETEWMTKEQIENEALNESTNWAKLSNGTYGTVYVEIIGCTNLPNMDKLRNITGNDKNDTFVMIVYEDNMARTDIIWDSNSPRWMPWTNRSFAFNVNHPASLLMLGVFDYDSTSSLDYHDPVGRVVINISNFDPNVSYLLHYKLHHDPKIMDQKYFVDCDRGTMTLRLRIEWNDPKRTLKMSFMTPPHYIINVTNEKSYQVLRYVTRGALDMNQSSIESIILYCNELLSYMSSYLYMLDVTWEILLWRGRLVVSTIPCLGNNGSKERTIWFPIHSAALLVSATCMVEYPIYIGPIILYSIAWILVAINYHTSRNPYPWKCTKAFEESSIKMMFGRQVYKPPTYTQTNFAVNECIRLEKLDQFKQKRVSSIIRATLYFLLKIYGIYSKTGDYAVAITTDRKEWHLLSNQLFYQHMLLKYTCTYLRRFRNFTNWKTYYTCVVTTNMLVLATMWILFPINKIVLWWIRILVWTLFGPWMKVIDVMLFQSWYRTKDQLLELIDSRMSVEEYEPDLPDYDSLLESGLFIKLSRAGRLKAEELYKLRDIREVLFGKYSEHVPLVDNSVCPSIPLPQSRAFVSSSGISMKDIPGVAEGNRMQMCHIPGQSFRENIIPARSKRPVVLACPNRSS